MKLYPLFILLILNLPVNATSTMDEYTESQSQYYGSNSESNKKEYSSKVRDKNRKELQNQFKGRAQKIKYLDYSGFSLLALSISLKWIGRISTIDPFSRNVLTLISEGLADLSLGIQIIKWYQENKKSQVEGVLNSHLSEP